MRRGSVVSLLVVMLAVVSPIVSGAASGATEPLAIVLDLSGSMWGEVSGEAKIVGARRVVAELGERLSDGTPFSLLAYGHRRKSDCADIETVLPWAPLDRSALRGALDRLVPMGKTPITAAVDRALGEAKPGATVVLVTDGLETCGGDPCAAVREARAKRSDFVLHVIGFDVAKEDVSSLECAAQAGGGLYFPAADAAELGRALAATAERAAVPAGGLVVRATRNGALQDVAVRVTPADGGIELGARTYALPDTNPRSIPLADGRYRVSVQAVGIDGAPEREEEIAIVDGGRVERTYDFSSGEIAIGASRNGTLSDVTWQLFAPGDRRRAVASGRTYRTASSNPARATVPAGTYDVVLGALEISGKPTWERRDVVVGAGASATVAHDFVSGELAIEVVRTGTLVDATVVVRRDGKGVDQGRTYVQASSNPIRFSLEPGEYEVQVAEIRGAKRTLRVAVVAGATETRRVDLAAAE